MLETQAAVSAIQLDQDQMLEKVRASQAEILMINKNIASNLKRQRAEVFELKDRALLSTTLIESLLVQAIAAEQALQVHMDNYYGQPTNLTLKASKMHLSVDNTKHQLSQQQQS